MAEFRITCINKSGGYHSNPHEAISKFGWVNDSDSSKTGESNRADMVKFVEDGGKVYVKDRNGNKVYCYVRTSTNGVKFLQTYSDNTPTDNLLSLPEC